MKFIYDNIFTKNNVKKRYSCFFFWRLTISYVTLIKLHFLSLNFICAGKGSNINSLPLLHCHQNISSSIQDPNPKQGKIFLRLKKKFSLKIISCFTWNCILLRANTLQNKLNNVIMNLIQKIEAHKNSAFPKVNCNKRLVIYTEFTIKKKNLSNSTQRKWKWESEKSLKIKCCPLCSLWLTIKPRLPVIKSNMPGIIFDVVYVSIA